MNRAPRDVDVPESDNRKVGVTSRTGSVIYERPDLTRLADDQSSIAYVTGELAALLVNSTETVPRLVILVSCQVGSGRTSSATLRLDVSHTRTT